MARREPGRAALLSIHPEHAEAILRREKRVELRRRRIASDITHVLIYATQPVGALVGWFEVDGVDVRSRTAIWRTYGAVSGVSVRQFRAYFDGVDRAVAIRVGRTRRLDPPLPLDTLPGVERAPQSFQYLDVSAVPFLPHGAPS